MILIDYTRPFFKCIAFQSDENQKCTIKNFKKVSKIGWKGSKPVPGFFSGCAGPSINCFGQMDHFRACSCTSCTHVAPGLKRVNNSSPTRVLSQISIYRDISFISRISRFPIKPNIHWYSTYNYAKYPLKHKEYFVADILFFLLEKAGSLILTY